MSFAAALVLVAAQAGQPAALPATGPYPTGCDGEQFLAPTEFVDVEESESKLKVGS